MFGLLSQPYPTEESIQKRLIKAALISLFIGLFLLIFQPFGLDDWQTPAKPGKMLGFGLVTFLVMIADSFLLPGLFPHHFSDSRWTIGKEIVRTILLIAVIAICNRFYLDRLFGASSTVEGWMQMMGMTFVIGIFPTVVAVLTNYIIQLRRYSQSAAKLLDYSDSLAWKESPLQERESTAQTNDVLNTTLTLVADNEKDRLRLPADSLLFIESSDNYCTVAYLKSDPTGSGQPSKPLLRSSLSRLETQITGHAHLVRCHRSYIVNLDRVERITGNAQGYKLHLLGGQFQIPVARRFNDSLISRIKSMP
ncbi:MAG: LytTR family transcriptional regulator [Spirosoma sp.]|nr:LytTR family transcriptional regulator [Spirosoma sp.]